MPSCSSPKRPRCACYNCGSTTHQWSGCPEKTEKTKDQSVAGPQQVEQGRGRSLKETMLLEPAYYVRLLVKLSNENIFVNALVDSGSPISLIKSCIVKESDR